VTFMIATVVNSVIKEMEEYDAGKIITRVNSILAANLRKFGRFAAVMLAVYNKKTDEINFTSAGLGELRVFRSRQNDFEKIENVNIAVGIVPVAQYKSKTIKIEPGDFITVFSDGINEAQGAAGEEFGYERFEEICRRNAAESPSTIMKNVRTAVLDFIQGADLFDDMTLLIFKRNKNN
ncbi:MAG TPA: PP2C family protein-serine/threonine phosphatase, partial [Spirochaetota bacterium]|nr:PP2C family protein-serine/threonine phosphatase [Spirochaetota bacterium]